MKKSGLSTVLSLGIATAFMGGLIWATHVWTAPIIEENLAAFASSGQFDVLPEADAFVISSVDWNGETVTYSRAENGAGFVFEVEGQGFGGPVSMLVGVDFEGIIQGVVVTEHSETPGLGDVIEGADFLGQFIGTEPDSVEVLSGATGSSEAVILGVEQAIQLFNEVIGGGQ